MSKFWGSKNFYCNSASEIASYLLVYKDWLHVCQGLVYILVLLRRAFHSNYYLGYLMSALACSKLSKNELASNFLFPCIASSVVSILSVHTCGVL